MENGKLLEFSKHYDQNYFSFQRKMGETAGKGNLHIFAKYIQPDAKIVDFGCGGGYLLKNIQCRTKIGIEINNTARQEARANGINVVASANELEDEWADVIISNHALEHTLQPLDEIKQLAKKIKPGGLAVFLVPSEGILQAYDPNDINHHLYTWSPMCLGNLFKEAGFQVIGSKAVIHRFPPGSRFIIKLGQPLFNLLSRIYGLLSIFKVSQSLVVARKL